MLSETLTLLVLKVADLTDLPPAGTLFVKARLQYLFMQTSEAGGGEGADVLVLESTCNKLSTGGGDGLLVRDSLMLFLKTHMAAVPPGLDEASAVLYKRRKKVFRRALREVENLQNVRKHETVGVTGCVRTLG